MSVEVPSHAKLFTLEEANATLPLVRAIVTDLSRLSRELVDRRERLALLRGSRELEPGDPYSAELAQIEDELEKDRGELQGYIDELRQLGVEPKNGIEGLVDFPCHMDGRVVYLCWRLGEPEVLYWHELDAGFAGRQTLTADSVASDSSLSGETDDAPASDGEI
ncbi:MAG: DUF2203 domain-containing protein [Pirellulales bacterium]|nr:DUF2203 domain-containing protein [Pirellulales bacterium]